MMSVRNEGQRVDPKRRESDPAAHRAAGSATVPRTARESEYEADGERLWLHPGKCVSAWMDDGGWQGCGPKLLSPSISLGAKPSIGMS